VSLLLALALTQLDAGTGSVPDAGLPPAGLACLPSWYAGTVAYDSDAGWGLALDGGPFLQWASSAVSADAGQLEAEEPPPSPDLKSVYSVPYVAGPIRPVDTSDAGRLEEPGRVRVEQLFRATYGSTREQVNAQLTYVPFFGLRYPFHDKAAPALARVVARLKPVLKAKPALAPFVQDIGGTWIWRRISRSKNLSAHAWGIAIDINVERSAYWRWTRRGEPLKWQNRIPQEVVDAFEAEGFIWGGRWVHYDTMHFEYRPELLSPSCRE
jgi:hypothetical protein